MSAADQAVEAIVAAPLCAGHVMVSGRAGLVVNRYWANERGSVFEAPAAGSDPMLLLDESSALPAGLATLLRLGPRPRLPARATATVAATAIPTGERVIVGLEPDLVAGLFATSPDVRASTAEAIGTATAPGFGVEWAASWLVDHTWRASNGSIRWARPPGGAAADNQPAGEPMTGPDDWPVEERGFLLLDTPAGMAILTDGGERHHLVATDPTEMWIRLLVLLPTDDELGLAEPTTREPSDQKE